MNRLHGVTINLFDREYDLGFGRQPSGVTWLMAINRETGAVLPLTTLNGPQASPSDVTVLDVDQFVPALEAAGVVIRIERAPPWGGFKLYRCEIAHAGLVKALAGLEPQSQNLDQARTGRSL